MSLLFFEPKDSFNCNIKNIFLRLNFDDYDINYCGQLLYKIYTFFLGMIPLSEDEFKNTQGEVQLI